MKIRFLLLAASCLVLTCRTDAAVIINDPILPVLALSADEDGLRLEGKDALPFCNHIIEVSPDLVHWDEYRWTFTDEDGCFSEVISEQGDRLFFRVTLPE